MDLVKTKAYFFVIFIFYINSFLSIWNIEYQYSRNNLHQTFVKVHFWTIKTKNNTLTLANSYSYISRGFPVYFSKIYMHISEALLLEWYVGFLCKWKLRLKVNSPNHFFCLIAQEEHYNIAFLKHLSFPSSAHVSIQYHQLN